jgi:hypothetical protein
VNLRLGRRAGMSPDERGLLGLLGSVPRPLTCFSVSAKRGSFDAATFHLEPDAIGRSGEFAQSFSARLDILSRKAELNAGNECGQRKPPAGPALRVSSVDQYPSRHPAPVRGKCPPEAVSGKTGPGVRDRAFGLHRWPAISAVSRRGTTFGSARFRRSPRIARSAFASSQPGKAAPQITLAAPQITLGPFG